MNGIMKNYSSILSICIPTYNRKDRLIAQLQSIFSQQEALEIEVVICDNASNYSINQTLSSVFHENILKRIRVVNNKVNIGGAANIASLFLHCNTPWMWILGDDDETIEGSISTILQNIEKYPDTTLFKYSIKGFKSHTYKECYKIRELVNYYLDGRYHSGDLIFISNNVYNMAHARKHYGETLIQCGCRISQLLPALFSLDANDGCVRMMPENIIEYKRPEPGSEWNLLNIAMDLTKVYALNLHLTSLERRHLSRVVFGDFSHILIIYSCLAISDKQYSRFVYNTIYRIAFKYTGSIRDKMYWFIFKFARLFNMQPELLRKYSRILRFRK